MGAVSRESGRAMGGQASHPGEPAGFLSFQELGLGGRGPELMGWDPGNGSEQIPRL